MPLSLFSLTLFIINNRYLEILFSSTGILLGAQVKTYLLEKVRLVPSRDGSGEVGERNYHVFYQFLAGFKPEERQSYGIDDDMSAKDFKILSMTSDSTSARTM